MYDIGGLVGAPAQRLWRQIGRIGLDQEPVERHLLGDVAQGAGILEGHNPREGDIAAEREPSPRKLRPAGKAMQHEGKGALRGLLFEDARHVVIGVARG